MNTLPYKPFQKLYDELVQEHSDAFELMEFVEADEKVENALKYFEAATFPLIYPAKSYAVAIIYAFKLKEIYGLDIHTVLDDEDLFLGQDPYFVPYRQDPETYDAIIEKLQELPNWMESGWAPKSVQYCLLECTEAGIQSLTEV